MRLRPHLCSSRVPTLAAATAFAALLATGPLCARAQDAPHVAAVRPRVDTVLGHVRVDPYFWLRDDHRAAPDVIGYLEAENRYTEATMRHTETLQRRLYAEMIGRIKETDLSVPEWIAGAWYYTRTVRASNTGSSAAAGEASRRRRRCCWTRTRWPATGSTRRSGS
jgi:oligopeptidase B